MLYPHQERFFSPETCEAIDRDLSTTVEALQSGETLGAPVVPLFAVELDYKIRETVEALDERAAAEAGTTMEEIAAKRTVLHQTLPDKIIQDLTQLEPQNDTEAARRNHWISQAHGLSTNELITYLAYKDLSQATLNPFAPPDIAACLRQTEDQPNHTVEYRYGPDRLQEGYYDNTDCFEVRTVPARYALALTRIARTFRVFNQRAWQYGKEAHFFGSNLNVSWHSQTGPQSFEPVQDDTWEGREIARRTAEGVVEAAVLLHPTAHSYHDSTRWLAQYQQVGFAGSPARDSVRILPGRMELRGGEGKEDFPLQMLGAQCGFISGVERDTRQTPAPIPARVEPTIWHEPGSGYNKYIHQPILRALQHSKFDPHKTSQAELSLFYARSRSVPLIGALCGRPNMNYGDADQNFDYAPEAYMLFAAILRDPDGTLRCDEGELDILYSQGLSTAHALLKLTGVRPTAESINAKLDCIEPSVKPMVHTDTYCQRADALGWPGMVERFSNSPLLRRGLTSGTIGRITAELYDRFSIDDAAVGYYTKEVDDLLDGIIRAQATAPDTIDYFRTAAIEALEIAWGAVKSNCRGLNIPLVRQRITAEMDDAIQSMRNSPATDYDPLERRESLHFYQTASDIIKAS